MATSEANLKSPEATPKAGEATESTKLVPVITPEEIQHFQELGLGRGIDSTDPNLWKNKDPIQLRIISKDLKNVIGTNENGIKRKYEKTVSSSRSQLSKIQLSLNVPSSHVKIGLDGHYSQSVNSSVEVKGTKIQTRTISFRYDFNDIPAGSQVFNERIDSNSENHSGFQIFENDMAIWILRYLKKQKSARSIDGLKGQTAIEKLDDFANQIDSVDSDDAKDLNEACRLFVFDLGVTHYVSSIELGAVSYSVDTKRSEKKGGGVGGSVGVASAATAKASTAFAKEFHQRTKEEQTIGHFNEEGVVRWNTSDEAVIGFQIQPINRLMRVAAVQTAMIIAIQLFIQSKTDDSSGPFLISTTINKTPVYWKVAEDKIIGTDKVECSSIFYFMQFGDNSFAIAYWGDEPSDRKLLTNVNFILSKLRTAAPNLPRFVTANRSRVGSSNSSLLLKSIFPVKNAQFSLYSRLEDSFACLTVAIPSDFQTWMEGDEVFMKHQSRPFTSDYVTMERKEQHLEAEYFTTLYSSRSKCQENPKMGILFRLHPQSFRETAQEDYDDGSKSSKTKLL